MKKQTTDFIKTQFGSDFEKALEDLQNQDPDIAALVENYPLDSVWTRPGLGLRERSLITISSQAALGRWDQVELHAKAFLHRGGEVSELKELAVQLSVYCGFPVMLRVIGILKNL